MSASSTRSGASAGAEAPGTALRRPGRSATLVTVVVAAVVVAVDQLTKWWALENLDDRTIDLVWTLRLNLTFNRGAAFGLGQGFGGWIALAAVVIVVVVVSTGRHRRNTWTALATGLMLGGAIGNLLDRAFRSTSGFLQGAVVDFVDLQWWPVFNVADACIVVGALVLVVSAWSEPEDAEPATAAEVGSGTADDARGAEPPRP